MIQILHRVPLDQIRLSAQLLIFGKLLLPDARTPLAHQTARKGRQGLLNLLVGQSAVNALTECGGHTIKRRPALQLNGESEWEDRPGGGRRVSASSSSRPRTERNRRRGPSRSPSSRSA